VLALAMSASAWSAGAGTPPENDNFSNATVLSGPGVTSGRNTEATWQPRELEPCPPYTCVPINSVWYRFTPAQSGLVVLSTCTTTMDTVIGVYTGSALGELTYVQTGDDGCGMVSAGTILPFVATAGVMYSIQVDGWGGVTGNFDLTLSLGAPPPPPPPSPAPPVVRCVVPRVIGMRLRQARTRITARHCSVGRIRRARSRRVGRVIAQTPRSGKRLTRGARVNLVVGRR
jgi:hypothetical protein